MPVNSCALLAAAPSKGRKRSGGDLCACGVRVCAAEACGVRDRAAEACGVRAPLLAYKICPFWSLLFGVRFGVRFWVRFKSPAWDYAIGCIIHM